jgi:GH24 family phage-related lysozyme (muramidase)
VDRAALKTRIRDYEGCEYEAYDDTEGYRTVAIGFNLDDPGAKDAIEGLGLDFDLVYDAEVALSDGHCEALLDLRLDTAINDAMSLVSNFATQPEDIQGVITDMCYNLGGPRFAKFEKTIAAFEVKDYCTAAKEMGDSKWARQVGRRAVDDIAIVQSYCVGG